MAGGGIVPTPAELRLFAIMTDDHVGAVLTRLDEDGWRAAQELLREFARRPEYAPGYCSPSQFLRNPENTGDKP